VSLAYRRRTWFIRNDLPKKNKRGGFMTATIMRIARVLVAQAISWALLTYGGVNVPIIEISVGALVNGIFKFIRDKYPKSVILEWLPI
jgi:hypothetical protein